MVEGLESIQLRFISFQIYLQIVSLSIINKHAIHSLYSSLQLYMYINIFFIRT